MSPVFIRASERRSVVVLGLVQGVGFRPFVYRLAESLGLSGFVRNSAGEVEIEAEGDCERLDSFVSRLSLEAPALARIEAVRVRVMSARGGGGFEIRSSEVGTAAPFVVPDAATCEACLDELFDPRNRRFRYPFINCTECGPRLTIVESAPYDRANTTMRDFPLCEACRAEYEDPASRRFHAQPNACAACGPRLAFEAPGSTLSGAAALAAAVNALGAGGIVAVKGIGGYHLACLASDEAAVRRLRERKQRDDKPFAVMAPDLATAERLVSVTPEASALLTSPARPIVLCPRREGAPVAELVAPGSPWLGVLLGYAPLHHVLLRDLGGPLVMTSGNLCHEPIEYDDSEARMRLAPIVDGLLSHDRPIRTRCDDSVVRPTARGSVLLRRARGLAPEPLTLERPVPRPVLALGAESNHTFALARERHVFVSHHLGDLEHYAAYRALLEAEQRYEQLFEVTPALIAHDLHPDYRSSALARRWAEERHVPLVAVQHHHAHVASVMLEHHLDGPVLGVAFDGTGLGSDGTIWGGEFLLATRRGFERVAHLRPVGMPGGDRAVLEPWRMALAYLHAAGVAPDGLSGVDPSALRAVTKLVESGAFCPLTSSAGRLFDAVAALTSVRREQNYDGQPAIELEWAALRAPDAAGEYDFELGRETAGAPWVIDTRPLVRGVAVDVARGVVSSVVARRFHRTLATIVTSTLERLRAEHRVSRVVLGGGVFANGLLGDDLARALPERGFELYRPERFPPGDGGLSLGQLAVAVAGSEPQELLS